jgi:hypothetical protein
MRQWRVEYGQYVTAATQIAVGMLAKSLRVSPVSACRSTNAFLEHSPTHAPWLHRVVREDSQCRKKDPSFAGKRSPRSGPPPLSRELSSLRQTTATVASSGSSERRRQRTRSHTALGGGLKENPHKQPCGGTTANRLLAGCFIRTTKYLMYPYETIVTLSMTRIIQIITRGRLS